MVALLSWVALQSGASFAMAASSFSFADLPLPEVSHASSSNVFGLPFDVLHAASACFAWHLMTVAIALLNALAMPSEHFPWSLVSGTQPVSSLAHEIPDPPLLQSKCWPGPGGAASATPAVARKNPPMTNPRSRFMRPPPFASRDEFAGSRPPAVGGRGRPPLTSGIFAGSIGELEFFCAMISST